MKIYQWVKRMISKLFGAKENALKWSQESKEHTWGTKSWGNNRKI